MNIHDLIAVQFVYPPIPDRSMDWRAVFQDYDVQAYGPTPEAAVRNLLDGLSRRGIDLKAEVRAELKKEFAERKFLAGKSQRDMEAEWEEYGEAVGELVPSPKEDTEP